MSIKLGGAVLLLCAFALAGHQWSGEERRKIRLIQSLSQALERMAGLIRWQKLPFLKVLQAESGRWPSGESFQQVKIYMESGMTLQQSWRKVFDAIPIAEARELLCGVELSGDTLQMIGALHLAAEALRSCGDKLARQQRQKERVFMTMGGCVAMMVIIILI